VSVVGKREPFAFSVNYAAPVPTAPLVAHALSFIHPDAKLDLAAAHQAGNTVLSYLRLDEVASDAPYRAEIISCQLLFAGRNVTCNSDIIELTDPRGIDSLVIQLPPPHWPVASAESFSTP
jgi:hypothetical protein